MHSRSLKQKMNILGTKAGQRARLREGQGCWALPGAHVGRGLRRGQRPMATNLRQYLCRGAEDPVSLRAWPPSLAQDNSSPGARSLARVTPDQGRTRRPSAPTARDREATAGLRGNTIYDRETESWPQMRAPDHEAG